MGKYTEPAIILNKQYETLNKGLANMYGNVAKNAELIRKREATKKQATAKRISEWSKIYGKNTSENYQGALDFTNAQPQDNENMQAFTDNLKTVYKSGYENIANMVKEGKSETEIAAYVQDQINAANNFTSGIVAYDAFQKEYSNGIQNIGKQGGKMKGRQTGDVVIGSQFGNIFEALSIDPSEQAAIPFDKLKMAGNLEDGVKFFYDQDGDNKIQNAEVLDFKGLADNYENGKNPYFKKIEDFTEITKQYKTQLDNVEKDPAFLTEYKYTDANGQTQKMTSINKKARQDYFLDSKTPGGKLIEEMLRSKDQTMLVQSVFGYEAANKFDGNDPAQMEALKIGLANKLSPSLFPGAEKLAPSANDRTTVTRSYDDPDPEIEVIENFTKPIQLTVNDYATDYDVKKLQKYKGRPYRQGADDLDRGIIDSIVVPDPTKPNEIQVKYAVNGKVQIGQIIQMNTTEGQSLFESNIVNGNFPKAKRERIEGVSTAITNGTTYDDADKSTRITTRKGEKVMSIDRLNEIKQEQGSPLSTDQAYEVIMGDYDVAGASPQANAAVTAGGAGGAGTGTAVAGVNSAAPQVSTYSFTQSSGLQGSMSFGTVPSNSAGNPQIVVDSDPSSTSSQIAKVLNWENENNFQDYGFTGTGGTPGLNDGYKEIEKQIKASNSNISGPQLKAMAAEETTSKYLIGEDGVDLGSYGGKTILQNLGVDRATFDGLNPELKHYLIDYKVNVTNRSAKDFIMILTGEWDGKKAGGKVSDLSDEDKDAYNKFKFDAAKLQNITPRDLELARLSLYTDGGTNPTRQASSKGVRPDQAGSGRMSDITITPVDHTVDKKDFPSKGSEADKVKFFIENKILPGDTINGKTVPNY